MLQIGLLGALFRPIFRKPVLIYDLYMQKWTRLKSLTRFYFCSQLIIGQQKSQNGQLALLNLKKAQFGYLRFRSPCLKLAGLSTHCAKYLDALPDTFDEQPFRWLARAPWLKIRHTWPSSSAPRAQSLLSTLFIVSADSLFESWYRPS